MDEFARWCGFIQNDAAIDIGRIALTPRAVRLIDKQL